MDQLDQPGSTLSKKINEIGQGVFYCLNESSQRIPVCIVHNMSFPSKDIVEFTASRIPLTENDWNIFAGELYFYRKGVPSSFRLHGIAYIKTTQPLTIQFTIKYTETIQQEGEAHFSILEMLHELINTTGLFFKKMIVTGF